MYGLSISYKVLSMLRMRLYNLTIFLNHPNFSISETSPNLHRIRPEKFFRKTYRPINAYWSLLENLTRWLTRFHAFDPCVAGELVVKIGFIM